MKKCPYCAEEIQSDAIKCKHCKSTLEETSIAHADSAQYSTEKKTKKSSWGNTLFGFFVGWTVLIIAAFIGGIVGGDMFFAQISAIIALASGWIVGIIPSSYGHHLSSSLRKKLKSWNSSESASWISIGFIACLSGTASYYCAESSESESNREARQSSVQNRSTPSTQKQNAGNLSSSNNSDSPDCEAILQDVAFLNNVFKQVRSRSYRATPQNCKKVTDHVNNRFDFNWHKSRRLTPIHRPGEHPAMHAARTVGVTCTEIVLEFACVDETSLRREHGTRVVEDYERDFETFQAEAINACTR